MAFFTLEDRYGNIECIAFPSQYSKLSKYINEDVALYVEGNLSLRDDEDAKILVSKSFELIENGEYERKADKPESSEVKTPVTQATDNLEKKTKLYLRVPNLNSREYLKAKNIVDIFDGDVKVFFYDTSSAKYVPYDRGVQLSAYIHKELVDLLGKDNVVAK